MGRKGASGPCLPLSLSDAGPPAKSLHNWMSGFSLCQIILVGDNKDLFMFSLVPAVPRCTFEWGINDVMYSHHNARVFSELHNRD